MRVWYAPFAFWLWTHEETQKADELFFESFLRPGDVVIDCGAHLGTLTMTASRLVGARGKVIACEMHPRTFSYLKRNIADNHCHNVELHHTAIGDTLGTVTSTDEYVSDMNHITSEGSLVVPIATIDTLAQDLFSIDLIKLDIEGYELQALIGAEETLAKTKAVYCEIAKASFARYNYALGDIILFLKQKGFTCYAFDQENNQFEIDDTYVSKVKYENILAIRN